MILRLTESLWESIFNEGSKEVRGMNADHHERCRIATFFFYWELEMGRPTWGGRESHQHVPGIYIERI